MIISKLYVPHLLSRLQVSYNTGTLLILPVYNLYVV